VAFNIPDVGTAKSVLNNDKGSPLEQLLISISQDICDQLKANLDKYDANTSTMSLSQSIQPNSITFEDNVLSVGINANYYWKFVNFGVNGWKTNRGAPEWGREAIATMPAIREWIKHRSIIAEDGNYDRLAYNITRFVNREGREGRPFFTDVMNTNLEEIMRPQKESLLGQEIEIKITQPWQ
jgi:hypothetical protein